MYNGWTESEHNRIAREERRKAAEIALEDAIDKAAFVELVDLANSDPSHVRYGEDEGESTPFVWGGEIYYPGPHKGGHQITDAEDSMPF